MASQIRCGGEVRTRRPSNRGLGFRFLFHLLDSHSIYTEAYTLLLTCYPGIDPQPSLALDTNVET
jgi:hypothetical protein